MNANASDIKMSICRFYRWFFSLISNIIRIDIHLVCSPNIFLMSHRHREIPATCWSSFRPGLAVQLGSSFFLFVETHWIMSATATAPATTNISRIVVIEMTFIFLQTFFFSIYHCLWSVGSWIGILNQPPGLSMLSWSHQAQHKSYKHFRQSWQVKELNRLD